MSKALQVRLTRSRACELTTEYGTRHLVALRDPETFSACVCRVPAGLPTISMADRRPGSAALGVRHHRERMRLLGPGWQDWHLTTFVLSAHVLAEDEIHEPTGPVAYAPPPDHGDDSTDDL